MNGVLPMSLNLPIALISSKAAREKNTTVENIRLNRIADKVAKHALEAYNNKHRDFNQHYMNCSKWHEWMAKVNAQVSALSKKEPLQKIEVNQSASVENIPQVCVPIEELTVWHCTEAFHKHLPRWNWFPNINEYTWTSCCSSIQPKGKYISITDADWDFGLRYLVSLKWKPDDCGKTSYIELAYDAWYNGVHFPNTDANPAAYATLLRKICNQACKTFTSKLFYGLQRNGCSSKGKTLPAGFITSDAMLSVRVLKYLAIDVLRGRGQRLKDWEQPFH